jgi:hypothetical protein
MKYAIKVGSDIYPINEDEVSKVMEAMATKSLVMLSCGFFTASFIQGIVRDLHGEKGYNYFYKLTGGDEITQKDFQTQLGNYFGNKKLPPPDTKELSDKFKV